MNNFQTLGKQPADLSNSGKLSGEVQRPPKRNIPYSKAKRILAHLLEVAAVPFLLFCRKSDSNVRKILLIEPFMLGDASFLSVMLDPLKARYPEAEIHLLIQSKCAALYENDPRAAKIHAFHMPWIDQRGQTANRWVQLVKAIIALRRERIDLALDVRGEVRSQILIVLAGIPRRAGFVNYLCSEMVIKGRLLTESAGKLPLQHRIHTCLDLCELVGCKTNRSVWLPIAAQKRIPTPKRILVHTGAGGFLRDWPEDRWVQLLRKIHRGCGAEIVFVGTSSEFPKNQRIVQRGGLGFKVQITSLDELMNEIDAADLMICLDSAPLHLAVLQKKPVLALFGPGPAWLYEPISPGSRLVHYQKNFTCAPCAQKVCVQPVQSACMLAISVANVFEIFCQMIEE